MTSANVANHAGCTDMGEAGIKDFVVTSWAAFVVPAGTPRPIIDKLSAPQRKIATNRRCKEQLPDCGARSSPVRPKPLSLCGQGAGDTGKTSLQFGREGQ